MKVPSYNSGKPAENIKPIEQAPVEKKAPVTKKRGRPPKKDLVRVYVEQPKESDNANDEKIAWREEMRSKWGYRYDSDGNTRDYSDAEFRELESYYDAYAAEYNNAITTRQKDGIIQVSYCRLEMKRCIAIGDSQGAKRYSDMINSAMTREAMKAGDVKALENTRIDSLIVNLENKGAIKNGVIVGKKELIDILAEDHPKFHTSTGVVDAILLKIINTLRKNNGESELGTLPYAAQIEDVFDELLSEPTKKEKEALAETGVVIPKREGEETEKHVDLDIDS